MRAHKKNTSYVICFICCTNEHALMPTYYVYVVDIISIDESVCCCIFVQIANKSETIALAGFSPFYN